MTDINIGTRNQWLADLVRRRRELVLREPLLLFPWRRPCVVRTLLVTDGSLDFGLGDFGLSSFVNVLLNERRSYVRFELTLAHLRDDVTDAQVMAGDPRIVHSIKGFRFDEPDHFPAGAFHEVWLFGIETYFHSSSYAQRRADPGRYPAGSLGDGELRALSTHMNTGGGIFATGDHGRLGRGLCGAVTRVRSMRYWDDFTGPTGQNEVSMAGRRRNDSNQPGHDLGTQFSDQSDDVPQPLDLKLYSTYVGRLRVARYPHPVLCSPIGRIDVFPDHPHEGECREPDTLDGTYALDGTREYPDALDGSGPVAPEVVARGRVLAGNTASWFGVLKEATEAHSFAVVSTYDGHRAGVGRVVCDSTWHHFVNVNLIGVAEGGNFDDLGGLAGTETKHDGFLSTLSGRAALNKITEYYLNVGVWIAPAARHSCFRLRMWWDLVFNDRLMEATLVDPNTPLDKVPAHDLYHIGVHARDVLGRRVGACQTLEWLIPWLNEIWAEVVPLIDPWTPNRAGRQEESPPLPIVDPQPVIDTMLGGALVGLRQAMPYPPTQSTDEVDEELAAIAARTLRESGEATLIQGLRHMSTALNETSGLVERRLRG